VGARWTAGVVEYSMGEPEHNGLNLAEKISTYLPPASTLSITAL
jgi:hypothetical protein